MGGGATADMHGAAEGNDDCGGGGGSGGGGAPNMDAEFFCMWCQGIEPLFIQFELGYFLMDIPDFRAAQHRINSALYAAFCAKGWKLVQFGESTAAAGALAAAGMGT